MAEMSAALVLERLRDSARRMVDTIGEATASTKFSAMMGVDTLNAIVLGFIFVAAVVAIAANIFQRRKKDSNERNSDTKSKSDNQVASSATVQNDKIERKPVVQEVMCASRVNETLHSKPATPSTRIPGVPCAKGPDSDYVMWIDNVLQWFHGPKGTQHFHQLEDNWITTLNAQTKIASAESGVHLSFEKIERDSNLPKLDNVYVTSQTRDNVVGDSADSNATETKKQLTSHPDVTVKSDISVTNLSFGVYVTGKKGETTWSKRCTVNVDKLTGKLNVACIVEELLMIVRFDGVPNMILSLGYANEEDRPVSILIAIMPSTDKEAQALELVIIDTVTSVLTSAVVDLSMSRCTDFPRFQRTPVNIDPVLPFAYDVVAPVPLGKNRKLLVKVMKATNLGELVGCQQPYCVLEMDNPVQKYQTSVANNTNNPFWDEHFLFDLKDRQSELLFEIYDKAKNPKSNFMGLAIVNQEELLESPSQRQIIPLQCRPMVNDRVSGSLTVEFLFMEGAEIPDLSPSRLQSGIYGSKQVETRSRLTPGGTVVTTTIQKTINAGTHSDQVELSSKIELTPEKPNLDESERLTPPPSYDIDIALPSHTDHMEGDRDSDSDSSVMDDIPEVDEPVDSQGSPVANGKESLAHVALQELGTNSSPNTTTNKSTLIIHSVQREAVRPTVKLQLSKNGKWHEVTQNDDKNSATSPTTDQDKTGTLGSASSSSSKEGGDGRARSKDKKSFMGTLKRRLSFHKKRSKSMDTDGKRGGGQDDSSRSVSSDRSSARSSDMISRHRREHDGSFLSVEKTGIPYDPKVGEYELRHPFLGIPGGSANQSQDDSTRSSISEMSGISSLSARTYLDEASTLVIETNENGVAKHYLIPSSLSNKSKWKKRGVKLHIYNDHVFLAAHLPGSTACQVCSKVLPRRLGKQGYVCRDCQLRCHKHCHVKVENHCPNSTVSSMEMEYVQDKKAKSKSS
ncbi:Phospholipid transfer protein C2CD2L [Nymphon striatum]|nr:Phospholipid transfer protein C2CD2L [Nymphon striatum]